MKNRSLFSRKPDLLFLCTIMFLSCNSYAQTFEVQLNASLYSGGYNVSCYSSSNGSINTVVTGGTAPFTYLWSNGATTKNLTNIGAGSYSVTVTSSAGAQVNTGIHINQPNQLSITLQPSVYQGGYNISVAGGDDGSIQAEVNGGVPPYTYIWSNGETTSGIDGLTAGVYSLTIHDMTNCTVNGSVTLTEPSPLHIVSLTSPAHHGYNISCADGNDGAINLTVAGGTPPYTFQWSNGSFNEDLTDLMAGEYEIKVTDANEAVQITTIILTQPGPITANLQSPDYPNGYSVSCFGCSNGSISSSVSGGVSPFAYLWSSGQITANLNSLPAGDYMLTVTDVNSCTTQQIKILTAPERDDWTMIGNSGSNPATNYIGTADNQDLVFKTNATERLRLKGNGDIRLPAFSGTGNREVYVDQDGILGIGPSWPPPDINCAGLTKASWAKATGNADDIFLCVGKVGIGVEPTSGLDVAGNMKIGTSYAGNSTVAAPSNGLLIEGNVGIGTDYVPTAYKLAVNGKIICEELKVKLRTGWPDFVFHDKYKLMSLKELRNFINDKRHLPGLPSAAAIECDDGFSIGEMQRQLLVKIEELHLYILQQQEKIEELQAKIDKN